MSDFNLYLAQLNQMLYGEPPSKEVSRDDKWDYLVTNNSKAPAYYYRGQGVRVYKNHVSIRHEEYKWIPNEQAISELRELMNKWKAQGWSDLVGAVEVHESSDGEESETYQVYESLGETETTVSYIKVPLSDVRFYQFQPYDPMAGLKSLVTAPRTHARITGLSLPPE